MKELLSGVLYKQNFLVMLLVVFVTYFLPKKHLNRIVVALGLVLALSTCLIAVSDFSGLLTGASFDLAMFACFLVVFFDENNNYKVATMWLLAIFLIAVIKAGASTALLVIAVYFWCYGLRESKVLAALPVVYVLFNLKKAVLIFHKNSNGRYEMWDAYLTYWSNNFNHLYGSGPGTFEQIAPLIPVNDIRYIWAHNDWLQIYLEYGLIGFLTFLCLFIFLVFKSFINQNYQVFFGLMGFGACMFLYSPLRVLFGVVLFVWLTRGAFEKKFHWGCPN